MQAIRKEDLPFVGSSYEFVGAEQGDVPVSFFLVEAQPGRGAPLHRHKYDEVLVMLEGHGCVVVGEETAEVGAGEIVVIKAGTPHGFVNIGSGVLRQMDVHAHPRFEQENLEPTEVSKRAGLPAAGNPDVGV
ncbi:MAG: cupin domain-containing protein [Acidobacteriaceae bacterium]|jgi:mannose-6-phosphate isomerase-like protein (cupin superfamily)